MSVKTETKTDREKITNAIEAVRAERKAYVDGLLAERQAILDKTAEASGGLVKPGKPQLTLADYQNIEELFNKQLAPLHEQLRLADVAEAAASIDGIEDTIEQAIDARDDARVKLAEAEGRLASLENKLAHTIEKANSAKTPRYKITLTPKSKELTRTDVYPPDMIARMKAGILNY